MRVTNNLTPKGLECIHVIELRDHSGDAVIVKKQTDQFFRSAFQASPPTYDKLHLLQRVSKLLAQELRTTSYSNLKEIHAKK